MSPPVISSEASWDGASIEALFAMARVNCAEALGETAALLDRQDADCKHRKQVVETEERMCETGGEASGGSVKRMCHRRRR